MITMKWHAGLLLVLLLFSAVGWAEAPIAPAPKSIKVIMLTILEYRTLEEIRQVCSPNDPTSRPRACTWRDKRGQATIAVIQPKNWCDWNQLKTWGHELWHVYGWNHSSAFKQYWDPSMPYPWWGENCEEVPFK